MTEYVVVWAPEGGGEEFLGVAESLAEARELVARHEAGEQPGTEAHLWATARAAGRQVPGCAAPPDWYDPSLQPLEWAGEDGYYAIVQRPDIMRAAAAWVPHRAEVQKILAAYFHDPEDYWDGEERRYELTWETEYDEDGYCVNDIVEELREVLPPGWEAEWTGDAGGDEEDFHVQYVGED